MNLSNAENRFLMLLSTAIVLGGLCQPSFAQYVNPAQQDAIIQQDAAQGLITPGQAANLINRENGLAQREARLLRNDGGVLTPRDAQKIAQEQAQNNAALNADVANRGRGFFSSLFAPSPVMQVGGVMPAGYYPPVPYTGYPPVPYTTAPAVVYPATTPVYAPPLPYYHHRRWERDHWAYY